MSRTYPAMTARMHPGHDITVTHGAVRSYLDCSCGLTRTFASPTPANRAALVHHHDEGGCNCPAWVVELDIHPTIPGAGFPVPAAGPDDASAWAGSTQRHPETRT